MAQVHLPGWHNRNAITVLADIPNPEGAQRGSFLRAVPALKEDHSVAIPFSKHDRLNAQMFNFGAKLIDLCQNPMLIKSVHLAFPQVRG